MSRYDPAAPLLAEAYAPYRSPRDYILSWTDVIWIEKALGRIFRF